MLPQVTMGVTGSLRGCMWPQGLAGNLGGSQVALGVTDGPMGSQMASGVLGYLVGSQVAMAGRGCPLGVAVDLGGSLVTLITCQIFKNALNFRIKLVTKISVSAGFGMIWDRFLDDLSLIF
jgi:hypothetical protein